MNERKAPKIVVAYDRNRGIGANNDLLWGRDLPRDLAHFKELTIGGSLVMGRNTFDSIGRALPGRQTIVVTGRPLDVPGVAVASSLERAYAQAEGEIYIAGGQSIYEQSLPDVDTVYATEVDASFDAATVFFPSLGGEWREVSREHHERDERNRYDIDFVTYRRV